MTALLDMRPPLTVPFPGAGEVAAAEEDETVTRGIVGEAGQAAARRWTVRRELRPRRAVPCPQVAQPCAGGVAREVTVRQLAAAAEHDDALPAAVVGHGVMIARRRAGRAHARPGAA